MGRGIIEGKGFEGFVAVGNKGIIAGAAHGDVITAVPIEARDDDRTELSEEALPGKFPSRSMCEGAVSRCRLGCKAELESATCGSSRLFRTRCSSLMNPRNKLRRTHFPMFTA